MQKRKEKRNGYSFYSKGYSTDWLPRTLETQLTLSRLKKTGVVDVQNPVQKAMDEGRFEEIE